MSLLSSPYLPTSVSRSSNTGVSMDTCTHAPLLLEWLSLLRQARPMKRAFFNSTPRLCAFQFIKGHVWTR